MKQSTPKQPAVIEGVGLFSAEPCVCTISPSPIDSGIIFQFNNALIPVHPKNISTLPVHPAFAQIPPRCSALTSENATIWTVEHILSALAGLNITNARIDLTGREVPIMDGSALPFVEAIRKAGIEHQDTEIEPISINETIRVEQSGSWIEASPSPTPVYEYTIDYGTNSPIAATTVHWNADSNTYTNAVAPARTFSLKHEADMMHKAGLFTHLSTKDLLVLDDDGPIDNKLRDAHECGYHKLLDLVGDVALLGKPINAHIRAHKSGHALTHKLVQMIAESV